ncbi:GLABROUS1 enhancer-binding protein-like [Mercurialis annua]|uniref:GLABROUS1 enhancer-binding protein-like n=1 Tax=Mercurialis annua TaxID=3986 RepID=UPI00215F5D92|nr:GLABROUS1 enhancer-binding protein-like [Mercurialis annua]
MAPKRPSEDPPAASSEEDEGSTSTEQDAEASSSEEEDPQTQTQTQTPTKPVSSSDSESGSESESESETDQPNNAPVLASKPLDATPLKTITKPPPKPSTKPARSKPPPKPSAKAAGVKRASEADADSKLTKKKTKNSENSEDNKKQRFERLWSEDDEIVLLEGIINFVAEKKVDPNKDMTSFYDYIMKSVHFPASMAQLKDKVVRMKKKFERHIVKNGDEMTFSNAHYQKSYDLSKLIWGVNGSITGLESTGTGKGKKIANNNSKNLTALKAELGLDVDKESQKVSKSVGVPNSGVKVEKSVGILNSVVSRKVDKSVRFPIGGLTEMGNFVAMKGMELVDEHKKSEMEERWKKLQLTDLQLFIDRVDFLKEQAQLVMASYKKE